MPLTVWRSFLLRESPTRCESYLRRHLGYAGQASLVDVCRRYMQATERPACSLDLVSGRVRVDNPPEWTMGGRPRTGPFQSLVPEGSRQPVRRQPVER